MVRPFSESWTPDTEGDIMQDDLVIKIGTLLFVDTRGSSGGFISKVVAETKIKEKQLAT